MATTWYLRDSIGNDLNGGTSPNVLLQITDGVSAGANTITSSAGGFTAGMLGHAVHIVNAFVDAWRFITAVNNGNSIVVSGAAISATTGLTLIVGGPLKTLG